jgi:hypothetical protein
VPSVEAISQGIRVGRLAGEETANALCATAFGRAYVNGGLVFVLFGHSNDEAVEELGLNAEDAPKPIGTERLIVFDLHGEEVTEHRVTGDVAA